MRLRWLAGRVPAARALAFALEDDRTWLLTRALPGRSGDGWLASDPALLPRIVDAFAGFLRDLHALDPDACPFRAGAGVRLPDAKRRFAAGLMDETDFDPDHAGWNAADLLADTERLAPVTCASAVTHGGFTLANLLLNERMRVTGCIDVGRLGVADPYQDVALLWRDLAEHGPAMQQRFLHAVGIPQPDPDRLAFHHRLDELF